MYTILFIFFILFWVFIYEFDKIIIPTVMAVADGEMRAKAAEIVNSVLLEVYGDNFKYDDVISIEKDEYGNITMLKADTVKMSKISCTAALESQKELRKLGMSGISFPFGYIFRNNILAKYGPSITVKMQPIGYINTQYVSTFESAGINQTNHIIYVQVTTTIRVIIPLRSSDVIVKNQIPIVDTIIVGKIPDTVINMDLSKAGYNIKNLEE